MNLPMGEAILLARKYLKSRGYPVPEDPVAFATAGRTTMLCGDLRDTLVVHSSDEVL